MKILIMKLGAMGDVVRSLPLAKALKEKYPDSEISWITKKNILELFENNPHIDRVFTIDSYPKEDYDLLFNFDIEKEATKIAIETKADKKYGFYSEQDYPIAFNISAEYYLSTMFDDELKKTNKKTYQEMMFDIAELPYSRNHEKIYLNKNEEDFAEKFLIENSLVGKKIIGIHMGASSRWPSKVWHKENLKEFISLADKNNYKILLFGGPNEPLEHEKIFNELMNQGIKIIRNNPDNSLREFFSLLNLCDFIVASDSLALHASLALEKPTIGLFFCTSPNEVEDYGLLKKMIAPKINEFFPERMNEYNEELIKSISAKEVLENILSFKPPIKVVNAIIKKPFEEKFLLVKRKGGIHSGKWAFPGGIVEKGESEIDALKREILEETNLKIKNILKEISEYAYPREDSLLTKGKSFLVEVENYDIVLNDELSDFKWVSLEELYSLDFVEGLDEELILASK